MAVADHKINRTRREGPMNQGKGWPFKTDIPQKGVVPDPDPAGSGYLFTEEPAVQVAIWLK